MPISEKLKGKLNSLASESDSDIADDEQLEELLELARKSLSKSIAAHDNAAPQKQSKCVNLLPAPPQQLIDSAA